MPRRKETVIRWIRGTARNLLLAVASLLVVSLTAELILRSTHMFGARMSWAQPDALIGWRFTPHHTYWYNDENDHPIQGTINGFGWRDREWTIAKPAGTCRIAVLGDSFVEGFQVEAESTFVAIAERRLNTGSHRPTVLMNFGRSGMTQTEEYLVLQHDIMQFTPDVVALFFVPVNDIGDIDRRTAVNDLRPFYRASRDGHLVLDTGFTGRRQYRLKKLLNPLKQRSVLLSFLLEKYNTLRWSLRASRAKPAATSSNNIPGFLTLCTATPDPVYAENYRLNKTLISNMAEYCKQRNTEFLLVGINTLFSCDDKAKYEAIDPTFQSDFFDRDLGALADSLQIEYLGLEGPFERYCETTGRSWHWLHWNYEGHRAVADALSRKLQVILDSMNRAGTDGR
jgi:lysophospholipase L1-like esterase